jgi:hypothetical protein
MVFARLVPLFSRLTSINEPLAKIRLHNANTYQRGRLSAESLGHELAISQQLWELQRQRLEATDPSVARGLAPLDSAQCVLLQQYVAARLGRKHDWGSDARKLLSHLRTHGHPVWERTFWKGTSLLPLPWFDTVVNVAMNQSRVKQLVWRLKTSLV